MGRRKEVRRAELHLLDLGDGGASVRALSGAMLNLDRHAFSEVLLNAK